MKRLSVVWVLMLMPLLCPAAEPAEIASVLERIEPVVEPRLRVRFAKAMVDYPPQRIQLIALKQSRRMELWAYDGVDWRFVHDYPIFAASGERGPKLREGDKQVPEGFYRIVELNPNSHFHLSLKLNYPNSFDWLQASKEGRKDPGTNIFIHGSAWSVGCLAVGNKYVEELFYLVAKTGIGNADVLIAPYDFRRRDVVLSEADPKWLRNLYAHLNLRLASFPLSEKRSICTTGCSASRLNRQVDIN